MTATDAPELIEPLAQHRIDADRLAEWLAPQVGGGPLKVQQFQGGMSNPTYLLTASDGARYVLRKKPPGKLLPSAHAVEREYRILKALQDTPVAVPRTYLLCEDESIIGTAFYVMERLQGRVFRDPMASEASDAEERSVTEIDVAGEAADEVPVAGQRDQHEHLRQGEQGGVVDRAPAATSLGEQRQRHQAGQQ